MSNNNDTTKSTITIVATATRELQNDVLSIYFVANESGTNANTVQEALRKKLADALAVVRPLLKEGEVETETEGFNVQPRYGKKSDIVGYYGTTALTVKGTNTAVISELASKITTMVVNWTGNSLSRARRRSVEKELVAEAIESFREKASDAAKAFGFPNWLPGAIGVSVDRPNIAMRASEAVSGGTPMQVESGKTEINASVQGSIILNTTAKSLTKASKS